MGLPCPNLGTGGYAFHGPYEHITVEGMDTETAILLKLVDCMPTGQAMPTEGCFSRMLLRIEEVVT